MTCQIESARARPGMEERSVADPLYLSLWFPSFELDEMLHQEGGIEVQDKRDSAQLKEKGQFSKEAKIRVSADIEKQVDTTSRKGKNSGTYGGVLQVDL